MNVFVLVGSFVPINVILLISYNCAVLNNLLDCLSYFSELRMMYDDWLPFA